MVPCWVHLVVIQIVMMRCTHLIALALIWVFGFCSAEFLRDEDVRLKIFSPESSQNSIALELVIFNRDEEFFVKIVGEGGDTICEGKFSRSSADRVKCSYDTNILKDGDNAFHVTIHSVANNELVLDTVSHFFYEAGSIVPSSLADEVSEYWEMAFSILIILLLFRFGPAALRGLKFALFGPGSGGSSPPPPNLPSPSVTLQNFNPLQVVPTSSTPSTEDSTPAINLLGGKILRAVVLGAAIILGGKMVTAPFRSSRSKAQYRTVAPTAVYAAPMQQQVQNGEFVAQSFDTSFRPVQRPSSEDIQAFSVRGLADGSRGNGRDAEQPVLKNMLHRSAARGFGRIRSVSAFVQYST